MVAIDTARKQARTCGTQSMPAATPWKANVKLGAAAEMHAEDMAKMGTLTHTGSGGGVAKDWAGKQGYTASLALDLVYGSTNEPTAQQVVSAWLATPQDCALIMNTSYGLVDAGVGMAQKSNATGTQMKYYVSVVVAKP